MSRPLFCSPSGASIRSEPMLASLGFSSFARAVFPDGKSRGKVVRAARVSTFSLQTFPLVGWPERHRSSAVLRALASSLHGMNDGRSA